MFLRVGTCAAVASAPGAHRLGQVVLRAAWLLGTGVRRLPQVQLQLGVQEVDQRSPGYDLRVAVVDHQPLVIDVLAADALGPRGQDDDLRLPHVQAWGTEKASDHLCGSQSALPLSRARDPSPRWSRPTRGASTFTAERGKRCSRPPNMPAGPALAPSWGDRPGGLLRSGCGSERGEPP